MSTEAQINIEQQGANGGPPVTSQPVGQAPQRGELTPENRAKIQGSLGVNNVLNILTSPIASLVGNEAGFLTATENERVEQLHQMSEQYGIDVNVLFSMIERQAQRIFSLEFGPLQLNPDTAGGLGATLAWGLAQGHVNMALKLDPQEQQAPDVMPAIMAGPGSPEMAALLERLEREGKPIPVALREAPVPRPGTAAAAAEQARIAQGYAPGTMVHEPGLVGDELTPAQAPGPGQEGAPVHRISPYGRQERWEHAMGWQPREVKPTGRVMQVVNQWRDDIERAEEGKGGPFAGLNAAALAIVAAAADRAEHASITGVTPSDGSIRLEPGSMENEEVIIAEMYDTLDASITEGHGDTQIHKGPLIDRPAEQREIAAKAESAEIEAQHMRDKVIIDQIPLDFGRIQDNNEEALLTAMLETINAVQRANPDAVIRIQDVERIFYRKWNETTGNSNRVLGPRSRQYVTDKFTTEIEIRNEATAQRTRRGQPRSQPTPQPAPQLPPVPNPQLPPAPTGVPLG